MYKKYLIKQLYCFIKYFYKTINVLQDYFSLSQNGVIESSVTCFLFFFYCCHQCYSYRFLIIVWIAVIYQGDVNNLIIIIQSRQLIGLNFETPMYYEHLSKTNLPGRIILIEWIIPDNPIIYIGGGPADCTVGIGCGCLVLDSQ